MLFAQIVTRQHVLRAVTAHNQNSETASASAASEADGIVNLFVPLMRANQRSAEAVRTFLADKGAAFLLA